MDYNEEISEVNKIQIMDCEEIIKEISEQEDFKIGFTYIFLEEINKGNMFPYSSKDYIPRLNYVIRQYIKPIPKAKIKDNILYYKKLKEYAKCIDEIDVSELWKIDKVISKTLTKNFGSYREMNRDKHIKFLKKIQHDTIKYLSRIYVEEIQDFNSIERIRIASLLYEINHDDSNNYKSRDVFKKHLFPPHIKTEIDQKAFDWACPVILRQYSIKNKLYKFPKIESKDLTIEQKLEMIEQVEDEFKDFVADIYDAQERDLDKTIEKLMIDKSLWDIIEKRFKINEHSLIIYLCEKKSKIKLKPGYIYVSRSSSIENSKKTTFHKIGFTTRTVKKRLEGLSGQALPTGHKLVYGFPSKHVYLTENFFKVVLKTFKCWGNGEHFNVNPEILKRLFELYSNKIEDELLEIFKYTLIDSDGLDNEK